MPVALPPNSPTKLLQLNILRVNDFNSSFALHIGHASLCLGHGVVEHDGLIVEPFNRQCTLGHGNALETVRVGQIICVQIKALSL